MEGYAEILVENANNHGHTVFSASKKMTRVGDTFHAH